MIKHFINNNQKKAIVIGGSAGSIPVLNKILAALPPDFPFPIIVCLHRMKNVSEGMTEVFEKTSANKVIEPNDKDLIQKGNVYIASSNYHLLVENDFTFSLSTDILENYSRPSIDITIQSCSKVYKQALVGILLTGANKDGVEGMCMLKKNGGITIVQDPMECLAPYMPQAAIEKQCIDFIFTSDRIIDYLKKLSLS